MTKLFCVLLVVVAGVATGIAEAHNLNVNRKPYSERLSHNVSHEIRGTHLCQLALGIPRTKSRGVYLRRGVAYRRYVLREWMKRHQGCAVKLRQVQNANVNWWLATTYANIIYPGTRPWLISCSRSEGGTTSFVMNNQGSGAGGWLQFMSGTFYAYVHAAFQTARERGYVVLSQWKSWTSPAGQAITGAYMRYTGKDGSHWVGAGC
jgi:hypothetical protein